MTEEVRDKRPASIVLVDDDPLMRALASARLEESGHAVRTAENGEEALKVIAAHGADLVIADLDMPVMDGFALTDRIRRTPALADVPVIVVTGSEHAEAVDSAFAAGATSFLAKPINWTLFGHSVRFVLKASEDQKELRDARDLAQAGAQFKDNLLSMMSHELRTPLNAIIGFGQILGDMFENSEDDVHREYAEYIVAGGKRLLNSISDILLASDASSGPLSINDSACEIGDLLDAARAQFASFKPTMSDRIQIVLDDDSVELTGDSELLARAISKLLDNAAKFSGADGKIVLGAAIVGQGDLAIFVRDNGPGVSPEVLAKIMQPFSQSDMSLRRSQEGLGLGLPLVVAISEAHGATFKIASAKGGGAQAVIRFPSRRVRAARLAAIA